MSHLRRELGYVTENSDPSDIRLAANANRCRRKDCRAVKRRDGDSIALAAEKRDLCSCTCGPEGKTILHLSGPEECVVCANALLTASQNCAVDVTDYNDDTPLHDAASDCQSPMTNVGSSDRSLRTKGFLGFLGSRCGSECH